MRPLVSGAVFSNSASVLSGTKSKNFSAGLAVTAGLGVNVCSKALSAGGSSNYGQASSEGMASLIDINGDGLPDIVIDGKVFFNRIDPDSGHPSFVEDSDQTVSPIANEGTIVGDLLVANDEDLAEEAERYPLHDVIRLWEAPYGGRIRVPKIPCIGHRWWNTATKT